MFLRKFCIWWAIKPTFEFWVPPTLWGRFRITLIRSSKHLGSKKKKDPFTTLVRPTALLACFKDNPRPAGCAGQTCKRSLILIWKFQDHVADLDLLVWSRSLLMILANWSWSLIFDLQNWRSILYYLKCLTVYWNQIIWCSGGFWCWANNVMKTIFKQSHIN